jgi:ubiquinone/menaquinone biosynthesis C-methylase UbiE
LAARAEPYTTIAPVYDRLIGDAGLEPIWAAFQHSRRRHRVRFGKAVDVACGTGRFLARLARGARSGVRLYGVDRSAAMLAVARRRLAGTQVVLLRQDMRALALPEPVDLLTCNFCSIGYLTEIAGLRGTLAEFYRNLCFNGVLIFDTMLGDNEAPVGDRFRQRIALPGFSADWDVRPSAKKRGSVVEMYSCVRYSRGGRICGRERHVQRWWPRPILERYLTDAGFQVLGVQRVTDQRPARAMDRWVQFVARRG